MKNLLLFSLAKKFHHNHDDENNGMCARDGNMKNEFFHSIKIFVLLSEEFFEVRIQRKFVIFTREHPHLRDSLPLIELI